MILLNWAIQSLKHIVQETLYKMDDWFERYFNQEISKKAMRMDFEHTEDPEELINMVKLPIVISRFRAFKPKTR